MSDSISSNKAVEALTPDHDPSTLLGTGVLTWTYQERVSDRYGTVFLTIAPDSERTVTFDMACEGLLGKLVAKVVTTRHSPHRGDFFRDLSPSIPALGERLELGHGQLFFEEHHGVESVGLRPYHSRWHDWLNPKALYACHHQTVELSFIADDLQPAHDDPISYRIWLQIEEYDELRQCGRDRIGPAAPLATFSTYKRADAFLGHIYSKHRRSHTALKPFTVVGYWCGTEQPFSEVAEAESPDAACDQARKQIASRHSFDAFPAQGIEWVTQQTRIIAVFEGRPTCELLES